MKARARGEPSKDLPITIGLDLAKTVFQVHRVDTEGTIICRRQLRRSQVLVCFSRLGLCPVAMEACAGAHHWARELETLDQEVRLMPPAYGRPCVKREKSDGVEDRGSSAAA